jgi:hypothetical protein
MSTCYRVFCRVCRAEVHLGTRFAGSVTFGEAAADDAGREAAMEFIVDHDHGDRADLRVVSEHQENP